MISQPSLKAGRFELHPLFRFGGHQLPQADCGRADEERAGLHRWLKYTASMAAIVAACPGLFVANASAQVVDMVQYEEELESIGSGGQEDITMNVAPNGVNTYSYTASVDSSDTAEIKVVTLTQAQIGTDNSDDLPYSSSGTTTYTVDGTITNAMSTSYSDTVSGSDEYISSILGLHSAGQQTNETYGYAKNTSNTTPYSGANAPDVSLTVDAGDGSPLLDYTPVLTSSSVQIQVDNYNDGDSVTYAMGGNGALSAVTVGASGSVQKEKDSTNPGQYFGGNGGDVTISNAVDITVEEYTGDAMVSSKDALLGLFGDTSYIGAVTAASFGGEGQYVGGVGDDDAGDGGLGGNISVIQNGDVTMNGIADPDGSNFIPSIGLWAYSQGGFGAEQFANGAGYGGNAGTVTVNWTGALQTGANVVNATGIFAGSVGGNSDLGSTDPAEPGNGGDVNVTVSNTWTIAVDQDDGFGAIGVVALSAGGQLAAGYGNGATSGTVAITADEDADITVEGARIAFGLLGMSAGNVADILSNSSSSDEAVGFSNSVTIENDGTLTVSAADDGAAFGIVGLSVGGALQVQAFTEAPSSDVVVGISGDPQSSGGTYSGEELSVTNNGTVTVTGPTSTAIVAMSVGGGGGIAAYLADASEGITDGGFMSSGSQATSSFSGGGNGGSVTVTNTGTVVSGSSDWVDSQTDQYYNALSFGIVAQSIGGGGGVGTSGRNIGGGDASGQGGGDGGTVQVTHETGSITTYAMGSAAIVAQSIGGGGGAGGSRSGIGAATGGSGGNGGDGGKVTVNVDSGDGIYTVGDFSFGIVAQSIGGGGGAGASGTANTTVGDIFSMATGGSGGSGGSGDDVTVTLDQTFVSSGARGIGIVAQSIGGGGGTGGQGIASAGLFLGGISYAVGGSGGDGGSGATVQVTNNSNGVILTGCDPDASFDCSNLNVFLTDLDDASSLDDQSDMVSEWTPFGTINLDGADAIGIMAQSIGGGGGDGGSATSGADVEQDGDDDINFDIGIGATAGSGGAAGVGGEVTVINDGAVITAGDQGYGILAQSISGGGGNGGDASASSTASGSDYSFSLSVSLGGDGGSGGQDAGSVTVTNGIGSFEGAAGSITTFGQYATGILAQSIAGGGGTGGTGSSSSDASTSSADGISVSLSVAVGGSGGTGNDGGEVKVTNSTGAVIRTLGAGSRGILAQSIGGGGGAGGAADASASGGTVSASASVGGSGGAGGNGGTVTIINDGLIYTGGTLTGADGSTLTTGGDGVGILAQSIGGGGGTGGSSTAETTVNATENDSDDVNATQSASDSFSANVSVGGSGAAGGDGGKVTVTNNGGVTTLGMRAHAIHGQSIGAGGGTGGSATSTADNSSDDDDDDDSGTAYAASISVAGSGGGAGDGGEVELTHSGTIVTYGYGAHGIDAQSIGGGGGQGADGTVSNNVDIQIGLADSSSGGSGGDGGTITITTTTTDSTTSSPGSIATMGDDAFGIFAQSIGGGGGTGAGGCTNSSNSVVGELLDAGVSYLENDSGSLCFGNTDVSADFSDGTSLSASIGGGTGNSGDGGDVTIDHQTAITTFGDRAIGLVGQSVGGGGGFVITTNDQISSSSITENYEVGGVGGLLTLSVDAGATVQTFGDGAWGLLAQSVGGAGGFVGDPSVGLPTTLGGGTLSGGTTSSATGLESQGFDITVSGEIETSGTAAHGIFAQAVGGGGGYLTDSNGALLIGLLLPGTDLEDTFYALNAASTVTVDEGGSVLANGASSVGIFAQSVGAVGSDPGADITINIDGTVSGGTGGLSDTSAVAAGVYAQAANGGTINISSTGSLSTADGVDGYAVYLPGDDAWTVINAGTLTGALTAGIPNGSENFNFVVTNTGTFNLGQEFTSGTLANQGKLSIGGDSNIYQTTASYDSAFNLDNSASNWLVDINAIASDGVLNDVLSFDTTYGSPTITIGGTITPNVIGGLLPEAYAIVDTTDGAQFIDGAVAIDDDTVVTGSYLYSWQVGLSSDNTSVDLTPSAGFTSTDADLTSNEDAVASYLQDVWTAIEDGETPTSPDGTDETDRFATVFGAFYQIDTASDYESALDNMANVAAGSAAAAALAGAQTTLDASLSCPTFEGPGTLFEEGSCVWGRLTGSYRDLTGEGASDSTIKELNYRFGGQVEVRGDWIVGGSVAFNQRWQDASRGTYDSDGNGFDVAGSVKYNPGRLFLAAAANVGYTWNDNSRLAALPGLGARTVTSESEVLVVGGRLRAAYELPFEHVYVRPRADLDLLYAHSPSYTENGPPVLAMSVNEMDHFAVAIAPALEAGVRLDLSEGWTSRLFGSVGFTAFSNDQIESSMQLAAAPAGIAPLTISTDLPQFLGNLDVGMQIYKAGGFEAKAEYGLDFGDDYVSQTGSLRVGLLF